MDETWEQTKARLKKQGIHVIKGTVIKEPTVQLPQSSKIAQAKDKNLFNIYKRSLPPGLDRIAVFNVTKENAEMLLDHMSFNRIPLLASRTYQDDSRETKTFIYFDIVPVDAKPGERSIYFNPPETRKARYDSPEWMD